MAVHWSSRRRASGPASSAQRLLGLVSRRGGRTGAHAAGRGRRQAGPPAGGVAGRGGWDGAGRAGQPREGGGGGADWPGTPRSTGRTPVSPRRATSARKSASGLREDAVVVVVDRHVRGRGTRSSRSAPMRPSIVTRAPRPRGSACRRGGRGRGRGRGGGGDLAQVVDDQGVAGDVHRQVALARRGGTPARCPSPAAERPEAVLGRAAGYGVTPSAPCRDGSRGSATGPARRPREALVRSLRAADGVVTTGRSWAAAAGDPVEVVAVQVREHDGVERRKLSGFSAGSVLAPTTAPCRGRRAARGAGSGIGEHRDAAVRQQGGGRADQAEGAAHARGATRPEVAQAVPGRSGAQTSALPLFHSSNDMFQSWLPASDRFRPGLAVHHVTTSPRVR